MYGSPGVGSVSISTRSRRRRRPVAQAIAPGDEVDRREIGRPRRHPLDRRDVRPGHRTRPKNRPPRASGAAWCRIDPQPDCESKPLTASRRAAEIGEPAPRVVRPHHHRAAVPSRRAARQPVVLAADHRDPSGELAHQRQPAGLPEHQPRVRPAGHQRQVARQRLRRRRRPRARSRSRTAAQSRSVAPRASGQSYIGRAATPPLTPLARPPRRGPDRVRHRVLAAQQVAAEHLAVRAVGVAAVPPQPLLAPPRELGRTAGTRPAAGWRDAPRGSCC